MTHESRRPVSRLAMCTAAIAAVVGTLLTGATPAQAADAPGTLKVVDGSGVAILADQVRLDSLNPIDLAVQTPKITIVPSPQNLPYRPSASIKLTWVVCLNKIYGHNAQGDCYFAPTPGAIGQVVTPRVANWASNGGVWSAPNYNWTLAPRNWATVGQGRYLFPWMNVTVINGDNFVNSTEIKPAPASSGAIIVNTLSTTTSIGDLKPAIRVGSTTYATGEQATIQVGSVPVNYDYFLRDSIRTSIDVPVNVWACPENQALAPGNYWEVSNSISSKVVTKGNVDQFVAGMRGCRAITIPCPECYVISDQTNIRPAIRTISLPANELLLANLQQNQQATIKLYPVQNANIKAQDRNTGDSYNQRIFSVGRPTTTTVVAAGRLPVVEPPAVFNANNLADAANNAAGAAVIADAAAIDAGAAPAAGEAANAGAAAPAAGNAGGAGGAGNAAAESPAAGNSSGGAAAASAPAGLAAAAGFDLTASPLTGDQGTATNGATTLRLRVPLTQSRGKPIRLTALVTPKAAGSVKFVLVRTSGSGTLVVGKVKKAAVVKGKAQTRWILARRKPAGAYSVFASYTPAKGSSAKGVTVSRGVTVK